MPDGGSKKVKMNVVALLLVAMCLFVGAWTTPVMAEEISVTRSFSTISPSPNSEFDVMLAISDLNIGGIVETLPDGFSYVSTTHPSDQVSVSGQKIAFAVINETEITYKVKAPSSGEGTFTGKWVDLLVLSPELEEGKERWETIEDVMVIVEAAATPTPTTPTPTVAKSTPTLATPKPVVATTPTTSPVTSPTPVSTSDVPGFDAIFVVASLVTAFLVIFRKKGKGGNTKDV